MAYIRERRLKDGSVRFYARYLGTDGAYHEQGGFSSRRDAEKAAAKLEVDAGRGEWASPSTSRATFADYVEKWYWPTTAHLEVSTRGAYRYYQDKHFIPRFGKLPMRRITPVVVQSWVNDASASKLSDLRPGGHRPGRPIQPLLAQRAAEGRRQAEGDPHRRAVRRDPHRRFRALPDDGAAGD